MPNKKTIRSKPRKLRKTKAVFSFKKFAAFGLVFGFLSLYLVSRSFAASGDFVMVATHPQAAAQPSAASKYLTTLKSWNGNLYAGFGDTGLNTGPITINPFNGSGFTSALSREQLPSCTVDTPTEACNADTEKISMYREIGGKLYAPSTDPRGSGADFAVATSTGVGTAKWSNPVAVNAAHVFDMVTLTGSDVWIIGSAYDSTAAAWRSVDGGASWNMSLSVPPRQVEGCTGNFAQFHTAMAYKGKLYAQALDRCASIPLKVFDGTSWSDANIPGLAYTHKSDIFGDKAIFMNSAAGTSSVAQLKTFDGTSVARVCGCNIIDFTIDNGTVYALTYENRVLKSTDLNAWTDIAAAPSVARSIALLNGTIYIGGSDSAIYKHNSGGGGVPDTIPPTVNISSPANGSTLSSRTNIQATSSDNVKVTKIEIYDGTKLLKTATSSSIKYVWNTRDVAAGPHTITVKAYDASGNVGQSSVNVNKQ